MAQRRMVIRPSPERPVEAAISFGDCMLVDAGKPPLHQTIIVEFPVLVSIGAEPGLTVIMVFVSKAYRNAIACESPELLYQAVV
jgi:hypothetical protein